MNAPVSFSSEAHDVICGSSSLAFPVLRGPLFVVLLLPSVGLAQANRGLTGSVLDPDGKAVANAAVVVRNEATGAMRTVVTDDHGAFALGDLAPATYAVEVLVPGFETVRRARRAGRRRSGHDAVDSADHREHHGDGDGVDRRCPRRRWPRRRRDR